MKPVSNPRLGADTPAWHFQVWVAFVLALLATTIGIYYVPGDLWTRGFLFVGLYFCVSSAFVLAKTLRDRHEALKLNTQIDEARAESVLRDGV